MLATIKMLALLAVAAAESRGEKSFREAEGHRAAGAFDKAFSLYQAAAAEEHVDALFHLGGLLWTGKGVKGQDVGGAVALWERAAEMGHARAAYQAGKLHLSGFGDASNNGVEANHAEATRLLRLGADAGEREAQATLGGMYAHLGRQTGVEQFLQDARKYLGLAAPRGSVEAHELLRKLNAGEEL